MKFSHGFIICLVLSSSFVCIEGKKKKKNQENDGDDRRPVTTEPLLYCNSCQAIVRETLKKLKDSNKEYDVSDALSDICQQRNFSVYDYPPPDMKKGCEAFMGGWSEEVERAFIQRKDNNVEEYICNTLTRACGNVGRGERKGNDDYVTINGKKVKMNDAGRVDINMKDGPQADDDL